MAEKQVGAVVPNVPPTQYRVPQLRGLTPDSRVDIRQVKANSWRRYKIVFTSSDWQTIEVPGTGFMVCGTGASVPVYIEVALDDQTDDAMGIDTNVSNNFRFMASRNSFQRLKIREPVSGLGQCYVYVLSDNPESPMEFVF